jgi:hypothetical protein
VIDKTEANSIQPPCPPQQVLIDLFVRKEVDHRLKFETKNFKLDDMTEGVNPSSRRPESPTIARFDLQIEQFTMLALKEAVACSGIEVASTLTASPPLLRTAGIEIPPAVDG